MGYFLAAIKLADLIESVHTGRKASMEGEDLILNNGSEREVVKEVCEVFPDIRVAVFPQTLVVESINLGNLTTLMVPS